MYCLFINANSMFEKKLVDFPIIHNRFEKGFFNKFLSTYLLFLFDLCRRLGQDHEEMTKDFLALLYTDKNDILCPYKVQSLEFLIYGRHSKMDRDEMYFLKNQDLFVIAFVHGFLSMKATPPEKIQEVLFYFTGLLVVNRRPNQKRQGYSYLFDLKTGSISYRVPAELVKAIEQYKEDFESSAKFFDKWVGVGRTSFETGGFVNFLNSFPKNYRKYLTAELKASIDQAYTAYKQKRTLPDTEFIIFLQQQSLAKL